MYESTVSNIDSSTYLSTDSSAGVNPDSILKKDDFMTLLLTELQYQDPTDPMDSEKILTQTSQLATLETQENTNEIMENIASQFEANMNMSAIGAIGKMAHTGSDMIPLSEDESVAFELYFANDIQSGEITITDANGNLVKSFPLTAQDGGILAFEWDGTNNEGDRVAEGWYSVRANYSDGETGSYETAFGAYPIESVRFEDGQAMLKLGSSYVPLENISEIYE